MANMQYDELYDEALDAIEFVRATTERPALSSISTLDATHNTPRPAPSPPLLTSTLVTLGELPQVSTFYGSRKFSMKEVNISILDIKSS